MNSPRISGGTAIGGGRGPRRKRILRLACGDGRVYAGLNAAFGLPTAAGGSVSVGWMRSLTQPTPAQLRAFLTGWSGQGSGGYVVGGSYTSTHSAGDGITVGASSPGAALKHQYGWHVGTVWNSPCL